MQQIDAGVIGLGTESTGDIVDVFCDAFADYPVMRYILGDAADYARRLPILIHLFVMGRVLRGEPRLGIRGSTGLLAAATMSRPDGSAAPAGFVDLRDKTWAVLGSDAKSRYEAFVAACALHEVGVPHLHINMIGVRRAAHGRGLARVLLDHAHAIARADPETHGITLSTENPVNVTLYEHFGYRVIGHAVVAPTLQTWSFFRPVDRT